MVNKLTEYILRHSKKRDEELKYDFMPLLLEIIERPAHKAGTVIILGIFSLLVVTVFWAAFSKMDVVITASGNIQPAGNLNSVKTYIAGTVKSIHVQEGDYVNKGDILISLEPETLDIDATKLKNQKRIFMVQKDLYKKIKNSEDVSAIKINEYEEELIPYIQEIIDTDARYKISLENLECDKTKAELDKQVGQLQAEEYKEKGMKTQIKSQELLIQQYELAIAQIEIRVKDAKAQYSSQINSRISEINQQLDEIEANLKKYERSQEYEQITAQVDGYVNTLTVNSIGDVVTAAQELATIVPQSAPLEMDCYVKNMDISSVEKGMEAEIKLEAYPYNKYGTIRGTVKYISPSAFANEKMGSVYLVKLELNNTNNSIDIISGLSGSIEIKSGKRSILDYFLEPIMNGFGESLKEK